MAAIRDEAQINPNTYLIDAVHEGKGGDFAIYLLKSSDGGTCLIDAGSKSSAPIIYQKLIALDAWPLDKIIITHSHWDHTQGIEFLRLKAADDDFTIEVFASEKGMPYLQNQSYNVWFRTDQAPYSDIEDVQGLKNNELVTIGADLKVTIIDTPGHMEDHISVFDETNRNIFVGDAIGMKWFDGLLISNPNSYFWNEKNYLESIVRIKNLNANTISLSHFGCLIGDEAKAFPDESVSIYLKWLEIFSKNKDRIEDISFLVEILWENLYNHISEDLKMFFNPGMIEAVELAARAYKVNHCVS